jgi:plasmid stabilization system protein ParE
MDVVDAIFKRARSLGVGQYPYIIRYRVRRDEVEILSIWHDRQRRPR